MHQRKGLPGRLATALREPWKIPAALRAELFTIGVAAKHGRPDVLLEFVGGIGDQLLLTAVAHEMRIRHPGIKIWQTSSAHPLLLHNPDYHRTFPEDHIALRYSWLLEARRIRPAYTQWVIEDEVAMPPGRHLIAEMSASVGLTGTVALRPYVHLDNEELETGAIATPQIAVQCVGEGSYYYLPPLKLWYAHRFQEVVTAIGRMRFNGRPITVVQLGGREDPPMEGAIDLRGKTGQRQTAAILKQSLLFVGTVGFLQHLARAIECRAVIIFGGREHAFQSGYECNINLESHMECAPCWRQHDCPFGKACMESISVQDVIDAIEEGLARHGSPLQTGSVEI